MTRARHRQAIPQRSGARPEQRNDRGSSVEALLTRVRLDPVIPVPRVSPEAGPWHQPTERTAAHPDTAAGPRNAAAPRATVEPKAAAGPKAQHRNSAPSAKIPVVRSLAGVLTVIGAVAGMDFGAAAVFGDHGASSTTDPAASPSAQSSPAAAPAPAAAPEAQPTKPPTAQALPLLPAPSAPAEDAKPPARPSAAAAGGAGSCVAPAGMTSLIDQDPTDEQVPWRRTGTGKVTVYFATGGMPADWRRDMEYGAAQWNKSPCLDTRVVNTCPTGSNCVTVSVSGKGDDGNFDAVERGGYTVGGHIDLLSSLTPNQRKNVAVHEMGHAVGLKHRKTNKVLMNGDTYDDVFNPDATEYRNLLFGYGRQRPGVTG